MAARLRYAATRPPVLSVWECRLARSPLPSAAHWMSDQVTAAANDRPITPSRITEIKAMSTRPLVWAWACDSHLPLGPILGVVAVALIGSNSLAVMPVT